MVKDGAELMKLICLMIFGLFIIYHGCAGHQFGFTEPTSENSMLVIGRIIVVDNGYSNRTGVHKYNIRVGLLGKSAEEDELAYWTYTDADGYFAQSDVPAGEYSVKAVQVTLSTGDRITIESRLNSGSDPYILTNNEFIIFNGKYFPFEPHGRIQSLHHMIFTLDTINKRSPAVRYIVLSTTEKYQLASGEILGEGKVEDHFINLYPGSAWADELRSSARIDKYRR
jgi:hypothetical protein